MHKSSKCFIEQGNKQNRVIIYVMNGALFARPYWGLDRISYEKMYSHN